MLRWYTEAFEMCSIILAWHFPLQYFWTNIIIAEDLAVFFEHKAVVFFSCQRALSEQNLILCMKQLLQPVSPLSFQILGLYSKQVCFEQKA